MIPRASDVHKASSAAVNTHSGCLRSVPQLAISSGSTCQPSRELEKCAFMIRFSLRPRGWPQLFSRYLFADTAEQFIFYNAINRDSRAFEENRREHGTDGWKTRSEEHTSELQSLMRNSYAVLCLKKK